jgi:acetoin utilization protein AcuB
MIVQNWMNDNPMTISSDMLVSQAKRILTDNNLRALPVVEEGRLRGVITRANCLRATENATRSQDINEINFFVNRLKVKDLMARNPMTVAATDTMEHCLRLGQDDGVSQFPVVEDGRVVGMVSATEVFFLAAQVLGVWEKWAGITLAPVAIKAGVLGAVTRAAEEAGAVVHSVYPVSRDKTSAEKRIILRFDQADPEAVAGALEEAGFKVVEITPEVQA